MNIWYDVCISRISSCYYFYYYYVLTVGMNTNLDMESWMAKSEALSQLERLLLHDSSQSFSGPPEKCGSNCGPTFPPKSGPPQSSTPTTSSPPTGTPPLLSCGTPTTGSTIGRPSDQLPECNGLAGGRSGSIEYKYVNGPFQNLVTISTCNAGTEDFDTRIRVYDSSICVEGNDDACSGFRSTVSFLAEAFIEYQVVVE